VIARAAVILMMVAGWAAFLLAFVWPTIALLFILFAQDQPPEGGFGFTSRQWGLLGRSVWLSAVATVVCLVVSLPAAYVMGRARRIVQQPLLVAAMWAVLLSPPMVMAFGWERLLPRHFDASIRCIGVWSLWAWPIPALLIGGGWSSAGRRAYEAALLCTSRFSAFIHAALPSLRRHIAASALILFIVFFGDYGVPHACGLIVFTTELLAWSTSSSRMLDAAWPAILPTVVTVLVMLILFRLWSRLEPEGPDDSSEAAPPSPFLHFVVLAVLALSFIVPMGVLGVKLASSMNFMEALQTYAPDLVYSLSIAILSGILAVCAGMAVTWVKPLARPAAVWTLIFGAIPGALIGSALIAAFNRPAFGWLYDHWIVLALGYVARFGWIGVVTAMLVFRHRDDELTAQARTDGAAPMDLLFHLYLPMNKALLCGGVAVIAALSLADVATSSLVRVPAYNPIAHVIIEKFHRFEDGMLISLSFCLVIASIPSALLLAWGLKRRR